MLPTDGGMPNLRENARLSCILLFSRRYHRFKQMETNWENYYQPLSARIQIIRTSPINLLRRLSPLIRKYTCWEGIPMTFIRPWECWLSIHTPANSSKKATSFQIEGITRTGIIGASADGNAYVGFGAGPYGDPVSDWWQFKPWLDWIIFRNLPFDIQACLVLNPNLAAVQAASYYVFQKPGLLLLDQDGHSL